MEQKSAQRDELYQGIDDLSKEIIKLKGNLIEILDYIDLKRKETDEQTKQQENLIESTSNEITEIENILEEKKRHLSESRELHEGHLEFIKGLSVMEHSVLDEYHQIIQDIDKNISPSLDTDLISTSYKKKIIDEYLSKNKLPIELVGNMFKIDNFGLEEIYDEKGTLACVFYKSYHNNLVLSSDVFMKYFSDTIKDINSLYFDYCKAAAQSDFSTNHIEAEESISANYGEKKHESEEETNIYLSRINQTKEQLLKLVGVLQSKGGFPGNHESYAFENSTFEILNENTLSDLQNQLELDFDQFFTKDKGVSKARDLVGKYQQFREGLGEERYLDFLLQQLGYPNTKLDRSTSE